MSTTQAETAEPVYIDNLNEAQVSFALAWLYADAVAGRISPAAWNEAIARAGQYKGGAK